MSATNNTPTQVIANTMVEKMGYDEIREGLYEWQTIVIGYYTDMAFEKDPSLPFHRVALIDERADTVTIESHVTNEELWSGSTAEFLLHLIEVVS